MRQLRELSTAARAIVVFTILLGVLYPLAITGAAQVAFPHKADGSRVAGGSSLIGRAWVIDTGEKDEDGEAITRPDPRYFQPRPSATGYSATATYFANRGPNQSSAKFFYRDNLAAYVELEGKYSTELTNGDVPVDAVTASGSGVDPHISEDNARIQGRRVAAVRRLDPARVDALVDENTDGRFLVFGERGVNTTTLNLALDKETR